MVRINSSGPCVNRTRVRMSDGTMITVCGSMVLGPFGDRGSVLHGHRRTALHPTLSLVVPVFSTRIRHARGLLLTPLAIISLSVTMVLAPFLTALVARIRCSVELTLTDVTTPVAAILLASIVRSADEEDRRALAAGKLVQGSLVFHRANADGAELRRSPKLTRVCSREWTQATVRV